jgi:hypothetical protein
MALQRLPAPHWVAPPPPQQGWPVAPQGAHMPGTPMARPVQPRPIWQVPLLPVPQQGWPAAPQVPHLSSGAPEMQASGAWHSVAAGPGQQTWLAAPQGPHVPGFPMPRPEQPRPIVHVPAPVPQQGWPAPPQAPHLLPVALVTQASGAVHAMAAGPEQQGWSAAPHAAQVPAAPPPRPPQPSPMSQVPPPVPQQGWPAAPQVPQVLPAAAITQPEPVWQAMPAVQHRWPGAPHGVQVPPMPIMAPSQPSPAWQLAPGQHGWLAPPHVAEQVPVTGPGGFEHARPALQVLAALPPQHCCPSLPHGVHRSGIPMPLGVQE